jgi:hypothetical protein
MLQASRYLSGEEIAKAVTELGIIGRWCGCQWEGTTENDLDVIILRWQGREGWSILWEFEHLKPLKKDPKGPIQEPNQPQKHQFREHDLDADKFAEVLRLLRIHVKKAFQYRRQIIDPSKEDPSAHVEAPRSPGKSPNIPGRGGILK